MALTIKQCREILGEAGCDTEKMQTAIDKIIAGHTATVEALKEERDGYKQQAKDYETVKAEKERLEKIVGEGGNLQGEYDKLKQEFADYKAEIAAKNTRQQKQEAYAAMLAEANIDSKRIPSIVKIADLDKIELDKDGNLKGKDGLIESAKTEWSDFVVKTKTEKQDTETPPQGGAGGTMTKEEIFAIKDASERQQAIINNHELFGF